jgi:hypothetical protein
MAAVGGDVPYIAPTTCSALTPVRQSASVIVIKQQQVVVWNELIEPR